MSTVIRTLKDKMGNIVLPRTRTSAITMGDGTTTLEEALATKASTSHKSTHATGQPDALTPSDIGAVEWFGGETTGTGSALLLAQSNFVLTDGAIIHLKLHTAMAQGATLNVADSGAHAIVDILGKGVKTAAGAWVTVIYNSTTANFVLQGSGGGSTLRFGNAPGQISSYEFIVKRGRI